MRFEEDEEKNKDIFERQEEYSAEPVDESVEEFAEVKVEKRQFDTRDSSNTHPKRPTWAGVVTVALVLSLAFGVGGGFLGYKLAETGQEKIIINQQVPEVQIGEEGTYYNGVIDVVNKVGPAVVSISVETIERVDTYSFFGGRQPSFQNKTVAGSGVIIENEWTEDEGYIITNNHVVEGDQAMITVTLKDRREFDAKLVGTDPMSDIAVLKVKGADLPTAKLGDSGTIKVGEPVVAIGNPYEFDHTVTTGVVSATERVIEVPYYSNTQPQYGDDLFGFFGGMQSQQEVKYKNIWGAIQTDAAINPGNSGGPLVALNGNVIGINTIKREGDNIGFAISSNIVKRVVSDLIKFGTVSWPFIGIGGATMTQEIAEIEDIDIEYTPGVFVGKVEYGPARDADIRIGDIITKVNDKSVESMEELLTCIREYHVGDEVEITFVRKGKTMRAKLELAPYSSSDIS